MGSLFSLILASALSLSGAPPSSMTDDGPPSLIDDGPPSIDAVDPMAFRPIRRILSASYRYVDPPKESTPAAAPPPPEVDDIAAVLSPSKYLGRKAEQLASREPSDDPPSVPSKTTASPQTGTTGQAPTAIAPPYTRPVVGYAAPAPAQATYGYSYPTTGYGYTSGYTSVVNADGTVTTCGPNGCTTGFATVRPGLFGRLFGRR